MCKIQKYWAPLICWFPLSAVCKMGRVLESMEYSAIVTNMAPCCSLNHFAQQWTHTSGRVQPWKGRSIAADCTKLIIITTMLNNCLNWLLGQQEAAATCKPAHQAELPLSSTAAPCQQVLYYSNATVVALIHICIKQYLKWHICTKHYM